MIQLCDDHARSTTENSCLEYVKATSDRARLAQVAQALVCLWVLKHRVKSPATSLAKCLTLVCFDLVSLRIDEVKRTSFS